MTFIKFGFLLREDGNIMNQKFVAFGVLPPITSDQKDTISGDLNKFYRYYQKEKQRDCVDGTDSCTKFRVSVLKQIVVAKKRCQVALTGELSNFLALFRIVIMNAIHSSEVWGSAIFFSDPIVIISENAFRKASNDIKITLICAAFDSLHVFRNQHLKLFEPSRILSAEAQAFDYFDYNDFESAADEQMEYVEEEHDEHEEDEDRFTVIDLFSSTGSSQNSLSDTPPETSLKSKLINRKEQRKSLKCCYSCTIS